MSDEIFYKIQRRSDSLFSAGGRQAKFNTRGKVWKGMGPLKNHLNLIPGITYFDCEIVKYQVKIKEVERISAKELVIAHIKEHQAKENAKKIKEQEQRAQRAQRELEQLRHLRAKYGDV